MQYTNLIWRDGQPYNELFDDIYYSSNESEDISGENEFQHVFFKHNGLPERWQERDEFVIAELGFGSGLNCILTIREWLNHCAGCDKKKTLHYIAIEKHPLAAKTMVELLSRYAELKVIYDELLDSYPPAVETTHIRRLFNNRVVIHYKFMDVCDALVNNMLNVDAWFLDGFSPAKNPDMWSTQLFENIAKNSRNGSTCSTYTAAGFVKRNLQQAGFVVNKVKGHGKKREMLTAKLVTPQSDDTTLFHYKDKPWFELPTKKTVSSKSVVVIGAGVAGLSLAYALVQRGWKVSIIDKHGDEQKQASSNPAPIVYPRLSIDNDLDTEFFTAAYCHALHIFKTLQNETKQRFWFDDGLLQLMDKKRITTIIKKFQLNSDFISIVDELHDVEVSDGQVIVQYMSAGVVLPAILCKVLKQVCGDMLDIIEAEVTDIKYEEGTWQCYSAAQLIKEAAVLVVANGTGINDLGLPLKFPVAAIRGQVVELRENEVSCQIKKTLNAEVHLTPAIYGKHYLGASYTKGCKRLDVCQSDNKKLLDSLAVLYPDVFKEGDFSGSWLGFRTVSKDRVPVVGALPDEAFFSKEYADVRHGSTVRTYLPARYLKGLYMTAAHGSRGFTSSFISAEIIASQLTGEPSPVNKKLLDYLSPSRFIINNLKRG